MINESAARQASSDWPEALRLSVWLVREHGEWTALSSEFGVAGKGATEEFAIHNMEALLETYLRSFHDEGASFADARRPIPLRHRLRLQLLRLRSASRLHHWVKQSRIELPVPHGHAY